MKKTAVIVSCVLWILCGGLLSGCGSLRCQEKPAPKYVFLFIGDGMGKPHVELARQLFGKLHMDQLPVKGSVSTVNVNGKTTDSAASGTAFACGVKTVNGRLGVDAQGNAVDSCAVLAKKQGRRVAVLTTVGVNNATPAAFYAHVTKRGDSQIIMEQFPASRIDLLCGSGIDGMKKNVKLEDFVTGEAYRRGGSSGNADAVQGNGVRVITQNGPFFAMTEFSGPVLVYTPGVDDLAAYVKKSIALLQDCPKGFFLMAEGGRIDHGGHANNGPYMLEELRKFDLAVGAALEFFAKHPEETLIIVSADHHTGGLTLTGTPLPNYATLKIHVSGDDTPALLVQKLNAAGVSCTEPEKAALDKILSAPNTKKADVDQAIGRIVDAHSGIAWKTHGHTSDEVFLFAAGPGAEAFAGKQENSDVGAKLKALFSSPER